MQCLPNMNNNAVSVLTSNPLSPRCCRQGETRMTLISY
jgi:hypothetical protein